MSAGSGSNSGGDLPAVAIAAVTLLILSVVASVVYLTAIGKPVTDIFLILSSLIAPTIASLVAVRKLNDVGKKVDGKIDNLVTDKSNLEQQIVASGQTPITAHVSYDPSSTNPNLFPVGSDAEAVSHPPTNPIPAQDLIRRHASGG